MQYASHKWSVLVVEQRDADALVIRATLGEAVGWRFDVATCRPTEVRDALTEHAGDIDVIVVGIAQRDIDELRWLVQEIRSVTPLMPLVVCPDDSTADLVGDLAGLGVTSMLAKHNSTSSTLGSTVAFAASSGLNERRFGIDAITGLLTRVTWNDRIAHALERCRRTGSLVAVMLVDVDDFKRVNDLLGHDAGDQYLIEVARRLRTTVREQDTIARLGGDEFGILLEDVRYSEAGLRVANKVIDAMCEPVQLGMSSVPVSVSVGLVIGPGEGARPTPEWINKSADTALYRSKESGKNRVFLFTDEMEQGLLASFRFDSAVAHGVTHDEFVLHYQPIVDLSTGDLNGFEALLRWGTGQMQGTPPSDFIPVMERMGLMPAVGRAVFTEAIAQLATWNSVSHRPLTMHVNMSAAQLVDRGLTDVISEALNEHRLPSELLVIEITESTLLAHGTTIAEGFSDLRERGVRVAIDDFGTGYNSLVNLKLFRPDILKVDRQFVAAIDKGPQAEVDLAIIHAQASLAAKLGIGLVAEGIETEAQRTTLAAMNGVELAQGYLFGHASPAATIETSFRQFQECLDYARIDRQGGLRQMRADRDSFLRTATGVPAGFAPVRA